MELLLSAMFLAMILLPLVHLATPVLAFADDRLPDWAAAFGAAFLWRFWRSHADLGRNWSPGLEVRDGPSLVTGGLYGRIRHPKYAAMWFLRIPREERMMAERFGAEWTAYRADRPPLARPRRDHRAAALTGETIHGRD
ncbi:hypothetical protein [Sphingopyxis sp.]|uniref:hypothetical protein n=1 Tax=Sphingopyxis sp. TaxID=1908224 RepID=UPI003D145C8C